MRTSLDCLLREIKCGVCSWQVAQAALDAVVPMNAATDPSAKALTRDSPSSSAGAAVQPASLRREATSAQPGSALGAGVDQQHEVQPQQPGTAAGAASAASPRFQNGSAASAAQGPTGVLQNGHGAPQTVSGVVQMPSPLDSAPPATPPSLQRSARAPISAPVVAQDQPGPVLQPAKGFPVNMTTADAAQSLSGRRPITDTQYAPASEEAAPSVPEDPQPAAMAAVMDAEAAEPEALAADVADDDDLPELPEGYSYLGRRMVWADIPIPRLHPHPSDNPHLKDLCFASQRHHKSRRFSLHDADCPSPTIARGALVVHTFDREHGGR